MALPITLVDYGPLYNAFGAKRNAGLLDAQRAGNNADLVSGLTQMVTDAAKTVYGIMQQGALEQAKVKTIALETEYSKRIAQGIYTGAISYDADGNLKMPQDLEDWYNGQQTEIEKTIEGYPDVKNWASEQIAQIRQNGTLHALDVAGAAAKANRDANAKQVLSGALDQSVARGNLDPFTAALSGQSWRSAEETAALRQLGEQDFGFRTKEGGIRNMVSAQGYEAGATAVEAWRKSGEVTADQADNLLQTAANQTKVQGTVLAQKAQASFTEMTSAGVDAEMAVRVATKNLPDAYKSQTEELLRAAAETATTRANDAADEKMQDFYGKNRDDPAGLRAFLDLPANDFSRGMKRQTYMYWDSVVDSMLQAQTGGGKEQAAMSPGERNAWGLFYDPMKTDTMVGTSIQEMVNAGILDPTIAPDILSKMSQRKTFLNPVVLSGVNVINSTFDIMAEKEKDPQKNAAVRAVQRDALMNLDKYLGEGPHTPQQVSGAVDAFLKPYKADMLKADWWNPATKTDVDTIRSQVWQGRYMPPDQQATFEQYDRDMLAKTYGVGKTPGTMIQSSEQMDNGMSRFYVVGLNPAQKDKGFWYTFQTDPTTGTEQLMVLERQFNAKNEHIGDTWFPAAFAKTLTQEEAANKEQQTTAAAAAAAQQKTVIGAAVKAAAAQGPLSIPTIDEISRSKKLPAIAVAEEAARQAAGSTPIQTQQMQDFLLGKGSVRHAQLAKAAADIGVSEAQLYLYALQLGVEVKP